MKSFDITRRLMKEDKVSNYMNVRLYVNLLTKWKMCVGHLVIDYFGSSKYWYSLTYSVYIIMYGVMYTVHYNIHGVS